MRCMATPSGLELARSVFHWPDEILTRKSLAVPRQLVASSRILISSLLGSPCV